MDISSGPAHQEGRAPQIGRANVSLPSANEQVSSVHIRVGIATPLLLTCRPEWRSSVCRCCWARLRRVTEKDCAPMRRGCGTGKMQLAADVGAPGALNSPCLGDQHISTWVSAPVVLNLGFGVLLRRRLHGVTLLAGSLRCGIWRRSLWHVSQARRERRDVNLCPARKCILT